MLPPVAPAGMPGRAQLLGLADAEALVIAGEVRDRGKYRFLWPG